MIVLTALLTANPDPQRRKRWECDPRIITNLDHSAARHRVVVFHDEPPILNPRFAEWVPVEAQHPNPYFARWFAYRDWLATAEGDVWCVDGSDVVLLHEPDMAPGALYAGTDRGEPADVDWLIRHHPATIGPEFDGPMFNAGLLGGPAALVREFARTMAELANGDLTDMGAFNVAAREFGAVHDWPHTTYKSFQHDHPTAWWRHK